MLPTCETQTFLTYWRTALPVRYHSATFPRVTDILRGWKYRIFTKYEIIPEIPEVFELSLVPPPRNLVFFPLKPDVLKR